jgi:DNA-binding NarL/FixJ family response regulator
VVPEPVLIVEDHELLAQALQVALEAEGLRVEVAPFSPDVDVLDAAARVQPSVVLLDLDLGPGRETGEAFVPGLVSLGAAVVVVTGSSDDLRLGTTLELGASGVLPKSTPFPELLDAVLSAAAGRPVMSDAARQDLLARARRTRREVRDRLAPFGRLTPRESEVLGLLMQGCNAESIAAHFVVSEATVRSQIRGVLTKLDVGSQLAAVAEAFRVGWSAPAPAEAVAPSER